MDICCSHPGVGYICRSWFSGSLFQIFSWGY